MIKLEETGVGITNIACLAKDVCDCANYKHLCARYSLIWWLMLANVLIYLELDIGDIHGKPTVVTLQILHSF